MSEGRNWDSSPFASAYEMAKGPQVGDNLEELGKRTQGAVRLFHRPLFKGTDMRNDFVSPV
jgi:hypothetical protein